MSTDNKTGIKITHSEQQAEKFKATVVCEPTSSTATNLIVSLKKVGYPILAEITCREFRTDHVEHGAALHSSDMIVVVEPHPCPDLFETLQAFQRKTRCSVLMFSEDSSSETIGQAARHGVQAYLTEVPGEHRLEAVVDAAMARYKVFNDVSSELNTIKRALKERKIVERAKGILMHRKSLDEATAYRAMQKMAMNRNVKLVELAHSMISASEILE